MPRFVACFGRAASVNHCRVTASLQPLHRPIAVADEMGWACNVPAKERRSPVRVFSIGNGRSAGRMVGKHLFSLGHSRVACFLLSRSYEWCVDRAQGLTDVYLEAGLRDAVTWHSAERHDFWDGFVRSGLQPLLVHAMLEFVLAPQRLREGVGGVVDIPGKVMVRASSATRVRGA